MNGNEFDINSTTRDDGELITSPPPEREDRDHGVETDAKVTKIKLSIESNNNNMSSSSTSSTNNHNLGKEFRNIYI